jgi:hypothetical protein
MQLVLMTTMTYAFLSFAAFLLQLARVSRAHEL